MRIDAHHHFWAPARGDYHWMPKDDPVLSKDYGPADLAPLLAARGIERTILVQAAATVEETEYLLDIAEATPLVGGVVGWVDFENPRQSAVLERLAERPVFKGVRPMIQDIADDDWMLREDVQWGFETVARLGLTFDCLGFPRHLENFHRLLTRHLSMRAVIDHCMKPRIAEPGAFDHWAAGMARLARDTGACVKLSGLVTEAGPDWTVDDLRPYWDHIREHFGPGRIMWGSDWPVLGLACGYDRWVAVAEALTADLSAEEREAVFGGTAADFYGVASSATTD